MEYCKMPIIVGKTQNMPYKVITSSYEGIIMTAAKKTVISQKPVLFKVVMIQEPDSSVDFVIDVLEKNFTLDKAAMKEKVKEMHDNGTSVCGIYSRDVAETKVGILNNMARINNYPVLYIVESNKS